MNRPSFFTCIAAISYLCLIAFVRLHPVGREISMFDFKNHRAGAVATSLCVLGIGGTYLYARKTLSGSGTIRVGCLGFVLAVVLCSLALFVGVTPDSWAPPQYQQFVQNLITVAIAPFGIVFIGGTIRSRAEEARG